jgi:subtilase family serine protease
MRGTTRFIAAAGAAATVAGLTLVAATGPAGASPRPANTTLNGSLAPFTASTRVIGAVAGSKQLSIQVWLRPRTAAAQRFATEVSTPGSAQFHHYLSPSAYTARFAASPAEAAKVAAWLRGQGFTGIHADSGRSYIRATATAAKIDAALHVQLKLYRSSARTNAGPYALRANNRPVTIPAGLAGGILGITGLDNAAPLNPMDRYKSVGRTKKKRTPINCSHYYGQNIYHGLPQAFGTTSLSSEICGYSGQQLRSAYDANYVNTGRGQSIALVELGLAPDMFTTLQDYARRNGLPAPSTERYAELSLGQGTTCGDFFDGEEQLDVEQAYNQAPSASELVVGGDSCNEGDYGLQGLFDADLAILDGVGNHPLVSIASNSWEGDNESQPTSQTDIENAYLVRAAAEGVGMFFSSGDASGVETPSSDPFATAVGATSLGIGKTGARLFETGWSTGQSADIDGHWELEGENGAAGGGPSLLWKQPAYQRGVVPSALSHVGGDRGGPVRSVPDISAEGDLFTGVALGILVPQKHGALKYVEQVVGGTSVASPLVAGIVAAAQQGQSTPFGFINPALYKLAGTSAINDAVPSTELPVLERGLVCSPFLCGILSLDTDDDQSPAMAGYNGQVTLNGYDNMTGLGSPHGQAFITALRRVAG